MSVGPASPVISAGPHRHHLATSSTDAQAAEILQAGIAYVGWPGYPGRLTLRSHARAGIRSTSSPHDRHSCLLMALTMSVLFINYSPSMPGLGTPMAQTGIDSIDVHHRCHLSSGEDRIVDPTRLSKDKDKTLTYL